MLRWAVGSDEVMSSESGAARHHLAARPAHHRSPGAVHPGSEEPGPADGAASSAGALLMGLWGQCLEGNSLSPWQCICLGSGGTKAPAGH